MPPQHIQISLLPILPPCCNTFSLLTSVVLSIAAALLTGPAHLLTPCLEWSVDQHSRPPLSVFNFPMRLYSRRMGGGGMGPHRSATPGSLQAQTQPQCRGAERCSETQPSGAEVPGRRRGPQGKNQVEVGQWPSLLLKHTSWVADATPHPIPCLRRRPLFIERAPWAGPPRRPPRGPPRYVDVAEIGHSMPPPHLPRQAEARVSASRPKPHQSMRWYRRNDTP